ncbi:FtsB family cell division protein [Corynebacterium sp. 335C]
MEDGNAGRGRTSGAAQLTPGQIVVIVLLMLFLVVTLIIPLRAWSEQRTLLAESQANIARLEGRERDLTREIEQAHDEAWVREQARVRLGVTEPGETPYRLIDPGMEGSRPDVPGVAETPEPDPWWSLLWESIARPPEPVD